MTAYLKEMSTERPTPADIEERQKKAWRALEEFRGLEKAADDNACGIDDVHIIGTQRERVLFLFDNVGIRLSPEQREEIATISERICLARADALLKELETGKGIPCPERQVEWKAEKVRSFVAAGGVDMREGEPLARRIEDAAKRFNRVCAEARLEERQKTNPGKRALRDIPWAFLEEDDIRRQFVRGGVKITTELDTEITRAFGLSRAEKMLLPFFAAKLEISKRLPVAVRTFPFSLQRKATALLGHLKK